MSTPTKSNGHDPATTAIIEVLERIEKEARGTNERLERLRDEVHAFREETREELTDLGGQVHQLREQLKDSVEGRLTKLEAVVFKQTGT